MRRPDLFPADRALQARMVLTAVLTPLVVLAALVAAVALLPFKILGGLTLAVVIGTAVAIRERREAPRGTALAAGEAPELHAMVDRLCVVADLPRPQIILERRREANSWIVDAPGRTPRLHITRSLVDLLEPDELQAVLAHELSHVANRDAAVMTVVGMPGAVLLEGSSRAPGWWPLQLGALIAAAIGVLARVGTNTLSRYREFSADAGACALTGRPSALASALLKVSGQLDRLPRRDLRAAASLDAFHLLAVSAPAEGWRGWVAQRAVVRRLNATHPSLERRLNALERLEYARHTRLAPPPD